MIRATPGHTSGILCVAFSPNSLRIATGGFDASLRIWNSERGECEQSISPAHDSPVSCVCWASDSKIVASGGADGTIRIWMATSGQLLHLVSQDVPVFSIAMSPDSQRVLVGSADSVLRMWSAVPDLLPALSQSNGGFGGTATTSASAVRKASSSVPPPMRNNVQQQAKLEQLQKQKQQQQLPQRRQANGDNVDEDDDEEVEVEVEVEEDDVEEAVDNADNEDVGGDDDDDDFNDADFEDEDGRGDAPLQLIPRFQQHDRLLSLRDVEFDFGDQSPSLVNGRMHVPAHAIVSNNAPISPNSNRRSAGKPPAIVAPSSDLSDSPTSSPVNSASTTRLTRSAAASSRALKARFRSTLLWHTRQGELCARDLTIENCSGLTAAQEQLIRQLRSSRTATSSHHATVSSSPHMSPLASAAAAASVRWSPPR